MGGEVVLSKQQREMLWDWRAGWERARAKTLRMALMDYAKELSLMKERIHRGKGEI
jgi:hypothetical protein